MASLKATYRDGAKPDTLAGKATLSVAQKMVMARANRVSYLRVDAGEGAQRTARSEGKIAPGSEDEEAAFPQSRPSQIQSNPIPDGNCGK
jgi:hypothetical protein